MDRRLQWILESLLLNVDTLNREIERLDRNEQFTPTAQAAALIAHVRASCRGCLANMRMIERRLQRIAAPQADEPAELLLLRQPKGD